MKQHLSRHYFIASLITHGIIIAVVSWAVSTYKPTKTFVVSASAQPTLFMPLKTKNPVTTATKRESVAKKLVSKKKTPARAPKKPKPKVSVKSPPKKQQTPVKKSSTKKKTPVAPKKKAPQAKKVPVKKPQPKKVVPKKVPSKKTVDHTKTATQSTLPPRPAKQPVRESSHGAGSVTIDTRHGTHEKGVQGEIAAEISRVWHPPVGVPKDTECTLAFVVDLSGDVSSVDLVKPSSHTLYNLSVQRVPFDIRVPVQLRGKRLQITFKQ